MSNINTHIKPFLGVTIGLLFVFCLLPSAFAQTTGGIKGKVRNMNGNSIAGATITVRQNGKDLRTVTSNGKGDFVMEGLESGTYDVVVDAQGYSGGVKYGIVVQSGRVRDLGDRLILQEDRGAFVIIDGSVYYKGGTSLTGAEVKIERVNSDGSTHKMESLYTNVSGEFAFRQRPGPAKFRITASYKGKSATKDVEVDNAAIYRLALTLDIERGQ